MSSDPAIVSTAATEKPAVKPRITDVAFVEAYKIAKSSEELSGITGLTIESARSRAAKLRKAGVKLAPFDRKRVVDVDALNAIIGE